LAKQNGPILLADRRENIGFCGVAAPWSEQNELNSCSLNSAPFVFPTVTELAETFYRGELRTAQNSPPGF
jgi:hypothetical protein